ncbi:DUF4276 family protein [Candidatus Palauibacter sp.]|uniref:DUF4276 family protein n=1 Tax=Candidatus Palauibacter sp. TaxID=3101350 RepID=UPI003B025D79
MSIKLYVEGGGDSKALTTDCRRGFRKFFEKAGLAGQMPRIKACGSRQDAYDDFKTALKNGREVPMLLVDAEDPFTAASSWEHLRNRNGDGWDRPDGASNDHCHLMVQVMESWFLADRPALESFYGQGFQASALPPNPHLEQVIKADVLHGLIRATRNLKTKKESYRKGSDSFEILGRIDPSRVESAAPSAKLLLDVLRAGGPNP